MPDEVFQSDMHAAAREMSLSYHLLNKLFNVQGRFPECLQRHFPDRRLRAAGQTGAVESQEVGGFSVIGQHIFSDDTIDRALRLANLTGSRFAFMESGLALAAFV